MLLVLRDREKQMYLGTTCWCALRCGEGQALRSLASRRRGESVLATFVNPSTRNSFKLLVVVCCLMMSWLVVDLSGGTSHALPYVFVIPIVLAAWYWSAKAAMVISLAAGFLCGPLMYLDSWTDTPQPWSVMVIRTVIFLLSGTGIGVLFDHMKEQNDRLQRAGTELISTLAHTIELRDAYTNGHCERVAKMAVAIGKELGLSAAQLLYLEWAALIHDIGKIGVPEEILNKTDKLTEEEFAIIKRHPNLGAWALKASEFGQHMRDGVLHHHERWDGKGYPYGQSGKNIPFQGRIIAVPDVWDAIRSERSYRKEMAREDSIQIMKDGRAKQFDPEILDIFLALLDRHPEW